MKKKLGLLLLLTILVVSLNCLTVFASGTANVVGSPVLRKAPLPESGKSPASITNTYTYNDPANYPLVALNGDVGYLSDSLGSNHHAFFKGVEQAVTASNMNIKIQISTDYFAYKDMSYAVELFKNNNSQLSFFGGQEVTIDDTSNNWILTFPQAKSDFSDQEYIYIRLGVEASYSSTYYSDTLLFKVSNPYYVAPVDYVALNNFVTRLYQLCLNRAPDQSGLNFYVNGLATKTFTGASASNNFIFSTEFVNRKVTDVEFINIMYKSLFDSAGDSGGKAYWLDKLANGMSRLYVLSNFVNSAQFSAVCNNYGIERGNLQLSKPADLYPNLTGFVYRFYDKCLERKPDDSGLNYWVNQLAIGKSSGSSLANGFVFSPEFTGRNLSNTDFMKIMYRVFFNRDSDTGGMTYWVNNLNAGMTRVQVFNGFVYSQEFSTICSNYSIKVR